MTRVDIKGMFGCDKAPPYQGTDISDKGRRGLPYTFHFLRCGERTAGLLVLCDECLGRYGLIW